MDFYQIPGTIRASFSFYNSKEEVDVLVSALELATEMLS
jgi:cysteine desulfurase/selenocysteine lyase